MLGTNISIKRYLKKIKINMSQSQTFNLIHQCYHYIISSFLSNKELLRCKENTLYMYSWAHHQKHNTAPGISICIWINDRETRSIRHTINPTKTNKTIKTKKKETQHRKLNEMSNTDITKNRGWTHVLAVLLCNHVLSSQNRYRSV